MRMALDTNIFIYYLQGVEPEASKVEQILNKFIKGENEGIVSTISIAEILTGFYMKGDHEKTAKAKTSLQDLVLNNIKIVPVTFEIADQAASLRAERGGKLPDALIVATALNQRADLLYSQDVDLKRYDKDIKVSLLP